MANVENLLSFLRRVEGNLPIDEMFTGPLLKGMFESVQPVLNMADYDPDSNSGAVKAGSQNFGLYGTLLRVERGLDTFATGGSSGPVQFKITLGLGEIAVYRSLNLEHDQGSNIDWFVLHQAVIGGGELDERWASNPVTSGTVKANLLRLDNQAKNVDDMGPGPGRDFIQYPAYDLLIQSTQSMSSSKTITCTYSREIYATDVLPVIDNSIFTSVINP